MPEDNGLEEVLLLIRSGQKIAAIKRLREIDGSDLKAAKERVEQLTQQLRDSGELTESQSRGAGYGVLLAILLLAAAIFFAIMRVDRGREEESSQSTLLIPQANTSSKGSELKVGKASWHLPMDSLGRVRGELKAH